MATSAHASARCQSALNLVRLAKLTGEKRYQDEAQRTFQFFAASLKDYGPSLITMAQALDLSLDTAPAMR